MVNIAEIATETRNTSSTSAAYFVGENPSFQGIARGGPPIQTVSQIRAEGQGLISAEEYIGGIVYNPEFRLRMSAIPYLTVAMLVMKHQDNGSVLFARQNCRAASRFMAGINEEIQVTNGAVALTQGLYENARRSEHSFEIPGTHANDGTNWRSLDEGLARELRIFIAGSENLADEFMRLSAKGISNGEVAGKIFLPSEPGVRLLEIANYHFGGHYIANASMNSPTGIVSPRLN